MAENQDVNLEESTSTESSAENNDTSSADLSSSEDVKTQEETTEKDEAKVPYARFKEVNDKYKKSQEILAQYETARQVQTEQAQLRQEDFSTAQAWQAHIASVAEKAAKDAEARVVARVSRESELKEVQREADFPIHADAMKEIIAQTPSISPRDALLLARARSGTYQKIVAENAERQVREELQSKQKGTVGQTAARETKVSLSADLVNAKGPDGRPKYSLKEIEEMAKGLNR